MDINQIKLIELQNKFREKIAELYQMEIEYIYKIYGNIFTSIISFVSLVDFYCNNAKNAIKKCYCKPIVINQDTSFISAKKMRHPLIEEIQTGIPYITNDIEIGTENQKGILLYGINSVGKSSLMKSVGINLILAQAGMYVACEDFKFSPYDHIFTRVPSGDNLFKSQSTFVSEINDLRTILKRSTDRSLVIGDELASGTEHISALSIVASGILSLSKKNTSFIFATHLHELCDLDYIKKIDNLKVFHLSVTFDKENDCLIFDRKLKEGNGNTLYGLEIAKSLDLPSDFLLQANEIRQQYTEMNKYIIETKNSKYNNQVFMDNCSICNKKCEEVHHIEEQQFADENDMIKSSFIHKNRKSNLVTICQECHDNVHNKNIEINGYIQTDKGIKLDVEHKNLDINYDIIKNRCLEIRNKGKSYAKILEIIKEEFKVEITLYKIKQLIK
jgi:DNA mismatch repair protein MutS